MEPDFAGWATKANLKCTDGRTIMPDAFKHMDGKTVPLVWQHGHTSPDNVLGHAILEARPEGVYTRAFFNSTQHGQAAKELVQHGDISALSIYANQLVEKTKSVLHGMIREVSLCLSGANPGALIDYVQVAHSDGYGGEDIVTLEDEAVITTGLPLDIMHSDEDDEDLSHEDEDSAEEDGGDLDTPNEEEEDDMVVQHAAADATVQDVFDTLTEEQKNVVYYMIGAALQESGSTAHSDEDEDDLTHQEGNDDMSRNVFEGDDTRGSGQKHLTHAQLDQIKADAKEMGSLRSAVLKHATTYGIENIDILFPDARTVENDPSFVKRQTKWVQGVLDTTRHTPFSRIKSVFADITEADARAKGYIKGTMKKEEFFALSKRTTTPTTVYKKQKLDRDDMIDITDMDVVAWLKAEMRLMLNEELAGAVLFGDGRDIADADKIQDPAGASSGAGIRSIAHDDPFYALVASFDSTAAGWQPDDAIDTVVEAMSDYEGSGNPVLYASQKWLNKILLQKDTLGRRLYANEAEVAQLMGVDSIVHVPDSVISRGGATVKGVIVNLQDYSLGTDKGGEVNMFDDFDIDFNQYKYLMETRGSGALTKYRAAVVLKDTSVTP